MDLLEDEKLNYTDDYIICLSKSEYISIKNTLNAMSKMFLAMPTHRKANKEKANLLIEIIKNKFTN